MIIDWLNQYAPNAPYLVIFGILLATGFGLPLPEDIPLIVGGYLCGQAAVSADHAHPVLWIMLPGAMLAIIGSDVLIYFAGRKFGPSIHRHPILKRIVGSRNLARTRVAFARHRAKFVFFARFLPGLRAPAFFTAGTFKMPFKKFLLWDGLAACISVPPAMIVGFLFHDNIEWARTKLSQGQTIGFVIIGVVILLFIGFHLFVSKKFAKVIPETEGKPSKGKPDADPSD
ncbi:MAG: DedA family protein [Planctomycetota bacterium]